MTSRSVPPDLREERRLFDGGHHLVAGIDEVGRGAWAGPVSVGAAVVVESTNESDMPSWLRDSKQLSEARRESIFDSVRGWCFDSSVGHASPTECDRFGMRTALRLASLRALAGLGCVPDAVVLDGPVNLLADPDAPGMDPKMAVVALKGADATCASVAAASIVAKVVRDRLMRAESVHFPAFGFEQNKGYPSPLHRRALSGYGLTSIHRRSWSYVADLPWSDAWAQPTENPT